MPSEILKKYPTFAINHNKKQINKIYLALLRDGGKAKYIREYPVYWYTIINYTDGTCSCILIWNI